MAEGAAQGTGEMAAKMAAEAIPDPGRPIYLEEAKVRIEAALGAEIGFVERLVWFWSNISASRPTRSRACPAPTSARPSAPTCSAASPTCCWRSRAIRRCCSISTRRRRWAPNSIAGINRTPRPQREPRARDPGAAYAGRAHRLHPGRRHRLRQRAHRMDLAAARRQSRARRRIHLQSAAARARAAEGAWKRPTTTKRVEQGRAVLRDLAAHPATATHVATKLARYFIADEPPPALVEQLAKAFRDTDGD